MGPDEWDISFHIGAYYLDSDNMATLAFIAYTQPVRAILYCPALGAIDAAAVSPPQRPGHLRSAPVAAIVPMAGQCRPRGQTSRVSASAPIVYHKFIETLAMKRLGRWTFWVTGQWLRYRLGYRVMFWNYRGVESPWLPVEALRYRLGYRVMFWKHRAWDLPVHHSGVTVQVRVQGHVLEIPGSGTSRVTNRGLRCRLGYWVTLRKYRGVGPPGSLVGSYGTDYRWSWMMMLDRMQRLVQIKTCST